MLENTTLQAITKMVNTVFKEDKEVCDQIITQKSLFLTFFDALYYCYFNSCTIKRDGKYDGLADFSDEWIEEFEDVDADLSVEKARKIFENEIKNEEYKELLELEEGYLVYKLANKKRKENLQKGKEKSIYKNNLNWCYKKIQQGWYELPNKKFLALHSLFLISEEFNSIFDRRTNRVDNQLGNKILKYGKLLEDIGRSDEEILVYEWLTGFQFAVLLSNALYKVRNYKREFVRGSVVFMPEDKVEIFWEVLSEEDQIGMNGEIAETNSKIKNKIMELLKFSSNFSITVRIYWVLEICCEIQYILMKYYENKINFNKKWDMNDERMLCSHILNILENSGYYTNENLDNYNKEPSIFEELCEEIESNISFENDFFDNAQLELNIIKKLILDSDDQSFELLLITTNVGCLISYSYDEFRKYRKDFFDGIDCGEEYKILDIKLYNEIVEKMKSYKII